MKQFFRALGVVLGGGINAFFAWALYPSLLCVVPAFLLLVCVLQLLQLWLGKEIRS